MKVIAIIQARMGSSRLPGKMLTELYGKPLIWHIIYRLKRALTIDAIVLATTTDPRDDALATFVEEAGLNVIRGPEVDVLGRFDMAAKASDADIIVRVNGDAPLIDPGFIDAQVSALKDQDADFVTLAQGTPCIHDGVDALSRRALDIMMDEARDDPVAIEHVSGFIKMHPERFKIGLFEIPEVLQWDGARLSIDTPDDLEFMEALLGALGSAVGKARLDAASRLLQARPDLLALNAHVQQKSMTAEHGAILIRADGGGDLGLGHVMRTLSVAQVLRDKMGYGIIFAMDDAGRLCDGIQIVEGQGFPVIRRKGQREVDWLLKVCKERKPGSILFDIRTDLSARDLNLIKSQVSKVVTLDDASSRRLVADVAIFPPVPQVETMDFTNAVGRVIADWDHVVLSSGARNSELAAQAKAGLFVNFGGSDPFALTLPAARLIAEAMPGVKTTFVLGPGVASPQGVKADIEACSQDFTVHIAPDDFIGLAASHALALIAWGVTAWELASQGVPCVLVCLDDDHYASAEAFEREAIGSRHLMPTAGCLPDIADTLRLWLDDADKRKKAGAKAASLIDGNGATRVATTMLWGQTPIS